MELATQLFKQLLQKGDTPPADITETMMKAYNKMEQMDKTISLWTAMKTYNQQRFLPSYVAALQAYARLHKQEEAEAVFTEFTAKGFEHNSKIFTAMIAMYSDLLLPEKAEHYYMKMIQSSRTPNLLTHKKMLSMYCHLQLVDKAEETMERLKEQGLTPDTSAFNSLYRMYSRIGDDKKAKKILDEIEKYNLEPDPLTYDARIHKYLSKKDHRAALSLYEEMKEKGIKPPGLTISRMVEACEKLGRHQQVIKLFKKCKEEGTLFNRAFNAAISSNGHLGDFEEAEKTFQLAKEMNEHNEFTYEALVLVYVRRGWMDQVERLFDEMIQEGLRPSLSLYHTLIFRYSASGNLKKLEELLHYLEEDVEEAEKKQPKLRKDPRLGFRRRLLGLNWTQEFNSMILRQYERLHKPDKVVAFLRRMERRGQQLDYEAYNTLVDLHNRLPAGGTATELRELMKRIGINDKKFPRRQNDRTQNKLGE